jgi:hypothetical protein
VTSPLPDFARSIDWLRAIRMLAQYIAPALVALALMAEMARDGGSGTGINLVPVAIFGLLTVAMIAICGSTVFLWVIDRLLAL